MTPQLTTSAPTHATPPGPVSAALRAEVRTLVRRHGVVVWLDRDEHYTGFVDELGAARAAGQLDYEVRAFRGSYLELMLTLEDLTGGGEPPSLLVHLPGFNEDSVKSTPAYELYRAGMRFRKKLGTLVTEAATGRVRPGEIASFIGQVIGQEQLSLEGADAWLHAVLEDQEGGLAAQLRAISSCALIDDLLGRGFIASRLGIAATEEVLWQHLGTSLALPASWHSQSLGRADRSHTSAAKPEEVAYTIASWALSVEYVDDLRRAPVTPRLIGIEKLPKGILEACGELAVHLRERHAEFYRRTADETETLLGEEEEIAKAEDLGRIDTFRFEEKKVLEAAIAALGEREWGIAAEYADVRVDGESFWIRRDPSRQSAWQLVAAAAKLGQAIALAGGRLEAKGHATALQRYAGGGSAVDRAHRELEQARLLLLSSQLPGFESLRARLDEMREVWRTWADAWARDFNALCKMEGFLPPPELQQRTLFEQVVRPATQESTTAYFVVDALRFEMGEALLTALRSTPGSMAQTSVHLGGRFAELPSNTEVGMNVLAPVADHGKLRPAIKKGRVQGFGGGTGGGGFRVHDPETRRRAMFDRVGGGTCPWLSLGEVLARDAQKLKATVAKAKLVVVHSQAIDQAGEKGVGTSMFDTVVQQLSSAWRLLHQAGVRRFVFTADHGFLLLEGRGNVAQAHGRKIDPTRRHVLSPIAADHSGEARVSLSELGYEGAEGHLMFPEGIAPFDTGNRSRNFVHGGNSLQERLIPVLTVVHRGLSGSTNLRYKVSAKALEGVAGMHCLRARVETVGGQGTLEFGGARELELALRVLDVPDVSVELCQRRGDARLANGVLTATVGQDFELFFRLSGRTDARALVALHHPSLAIEVEEGGPERRFAVAASSHVPKPARGKALDSSGAADAKASATEASATKARAEKARAEKTGAEKTGAEKTGAEKTGAEKTGAEKTGAEKTGAEKTGADKAGASRAGANQPSLAPGAWLTKLPEGVREVFAHIEAHGACVENEVVQKLGGARAARRFSREFEKYAALAPFEASIEVVAGVKRYVKKGSGS